MTRNSKPDARLRERTIESTISCDLAGARHAAAAGNLESVDRAISRALRDIAMLFEPLERDRDRPTRLVWQELRLNRNAVVSAQHLCQEAGDHLPDLGVAGTKIDQAIRFWNKRKKPDGDWATLEGE